MNRVEQAICRIREKLPNGQGFITLGCGCVVKNDELAESLGWKSPNVLVTTNAVLNPELLALDKGFFAEFLVKDKKGYEVFDLKLATEFCKVVRARDVSNDPANELANEQQQEQGELNYEGLTFLSVEPLDKRGFLKKMMKKSSLQTNRPINCCNFNEDGFLEEISEGYFCNVLRDVGPTSQEFETRTYRFGYNEETEEFVLKDFVGPNIPLEVRNFPNDQQPLGAVIFSKHGEFAGSIGFKGEQLTPFFVRDFKEAETQEQINNNLSGETEDEVKMRDEELPKEGSDVLAITEDSAAQGDQISTPENVEPGVVQEMKDEEVSEEVSGLSIVNEDTVAQKDVISPPENVEPGDMRQMKDEEVSQEGSGLSIVNEDTDAQNEVIASSENVEPGDVWQIKDDDDEVSQEGSSLSIVKEDTVAQNDVISTPEDLEPGDVQNMKGEEVSQDVSGFPVVNEDTVAQKDVASVPQNVDVDISNEGEGTEEDDLVVRISVDHEEINDGHKEQVENKIESVEDDVFDLKDQKVMDVDEQNELETSESKVDEEKTSDVAENEVRTETSEQNLQSTERFNENELKTEDQENMPVDDTLLNMIGDGLEAGEGSKDTKMEDISQVSVEEVNMEANKDVNDLEVESKDQTVAKDENVVETSDGEAIPGHDSETVESPQEEFIDKVPEGNKSVEQGSKQDDVVGKEVCDELEEKKEESNELDEPGDIAPDISTSDISDIDRPGTETSDSVQDSDELKKEQHEEQNIVETKEIGIEIDQSFVSDSTTDVKTEGEMITSSSDKNVDGEETVVQIVENIVTDPSADGKIEGDMGTHGLDENVKGKEIEIETDKNTVSDSCTDAIVKEGEMVTSSSDRNVEGEGTEIEFGQNIVSDSNTNVKIEGEMVTYVLDENVEGKEGLIKNILLEPTEKVTEETLCTSEDFSEETKEEGNLQRKAEDGNVEVDTPRTETDDHSVATGPKTGDDLEVLRSGTEEISSENVIHEKQNEAESTEEDKQTYSEQIASESLSRHEKKVETITKDNISESKQEIMEDLSPCKPEDHVESSDVLSIESQEVSGEGVSKSAVEEIVHAGPEQSKEETESKDVGDVVEPATEEEKDAGVKEEGKEALVDNTVTSLVPETPDGVVVLQDHVEDSTDVGRSLHMEETELMQTNEEKSDVKLPDTRLPLLPDDLLSEAVTNNPKVLDDLSKCLDTEYQYGGIPCWRDLGEVLAIPPEAYEHCSSFSETSPTEDLLMFLSATKPQLTVSDVKDSLRAIGRTDVVQILERCINRSIISNESVVGSLVERDDTDLLGRVAIKLDPGYARNWKALAVQLEIPRRVFRNFGSHQRHNSALLLFKYLPIFNPDLSIKSIRDACNAIGRLDVVKKLDTSGIPADDPVKNILDDADLMDELTDYLNEEDATNNWRQLAAELEVPPEKASIFAPAAKNSPTAMLLRSIEQCEPDVTVEELILALVAMKRQDVIEMLGKHFRPEDIRSILEENNCLPPEPIKEENQGEPDEDP